MHHSNTFKSQKIFVFLWLIAVTASAFAQTDNGTIRGAITDTTGAALPAAAITLMDDATHQVRESKTDRAGVYVFNALRPSTYSLHVAATGFGGADRTSISVATQDFLTIDVQLFVNTGNPQFIRFADQNGTSQTSVAGGPIASNLYLIDGVPITDTNNRPVVIPTIEAIQDVKVQALTYDAQVGRTGGGVFNTLLRSGSNTIHGSLFGETRQTAWLANDFFANRSGTPRPDSPYYNWGASLGGPVVIPHVYDGRNKTFFWIAQKATFRLRLTLRRLPCRPISKGPATSHRPSTRMEPCTSSITRTQRLPMRQAFIALRLPETRSTTPTP